MDIQVYLIITVTALYSGVEYQDKVIPFKPAVSQEGTPHITAYLHGKMYLNGFLPFDR